MTGSRYAQLNDKGWLHQKYWVEKQNLDKIADIVGCHSTTVLDALVRTNLGTRNVSEVTKGKANPNYGRHASKKTREKMRVAHTGKHPLKLTLIQRHVNNVISCAINRSLKGAKNGLHWENIVGYTVADLIQTLEKDFRDGMTWDNYGPLWHIDHMIPLARFEYDSPEDPEFKKAWALNNLQPLWANENRLKSDKFMFF